LFSGRFKEHGVPVWPPGAMQAKGNSLATLLIC